MNCFNFSCKIIAAMRFQIFTDRKNAVIQHMNEMKWKMLYAGTVTTKCQRFGEITKHCTHLSKQRQLFK